MKVRILVAEPDWFLARMYFENLNKHGYEVELCSSGSECMQKYRHDASHDQDTKYDILILNEELEAKSGIRIIDEILFLNPGQKILVISDKKDLPNRAVSVIVKPFSMYGLIQEIGKIASKLENPYLNYSS